MDSPRSLQVADGSVPSCLLIAIVAVPDPHVLKLRWPQGPLEEQGDWLIPTHSEAPDAEALSRRRQSYPKWSPCHRQ